MSTWGLYQEPDGGEYPSSAGLVEYTCGDSVKPAMVGACEARTPLL